MTSNEDALAQLMALSQNDPLGGVPTLDFSKGVYPTNYPAPIPQVQKRPSLFNRFKKGAETLVDKIQGEPETPAREVGEVVAVPALPADNDPFVDRLFYAINHAEMQGQEDHWIRTKHAPRNNVSTAYGPLQITATLAKDYRERKAKMFTEEELNYLDRFISQGEKFAKTKKKKDPVYGYGGKGELTSEEDKALYLSVGKKMLQDVAEKHKGDADKVWRVWHFGNAKGKGNSAYKKRFYEALNATEE